MIGQNENDDLENTAIVIYDVILDIPDFAATMYTILYLKNLNVLSPICTGVRRSASVCPMESYPMYEQFCHKDPVLH